VASLKHEKEDVREMRAGFECGIGLKNFSDIQVGDLIECYVLEKAEAE
jgi:translation initiation factor IF-2